MLQFQNQRSHTRCNQRKNKQFQQKHLNSVEQTRRKAILLLTKNSRRNLVRQHNVKNVLQFNARSFSVEIRK